MFLGNYIMMLRRWKVLCIIKKYWFFFLGLFVALVIYNALNNFPNFFIDGYSRYKVQELEIKNDLLLMQLDLSRQKLAKLTNGSIDIYNDSHNLDTHVSQCEDIHVAIVCAGHHSSNTIVTMIKSILFYRRNRIYFYILVDDVAENILRYLFDTWDLPAVVVHFYPMKEVINLVKWIPNNHYSGVYGLLKLTLPTILPKNLTKVIVLDTDITFAADIAQLWSIFHKFDKSQAIGLVENQSNWYLGKLKNNYKPWPAIGRGFNTGVILMHLNRFNDLKWNSLWLNVTRRALTTHQSTALADQDIFNAVIKEKSEIVYQVPCEWNVQLGDHTLSEKCYKFQEVKAVHWNSPRKHKVKNKDISYFQSVYYMFLQLNGNLLRTKSLDCNFTNIQTQISEGSCEELRKFEYTKWRTHLYVNEYIYEPSLDGVDICMILHLPFEKIEDFEEICRHWEGPVSLAVYATDHEVEFLLNFIDSSSVLQSRFNIAYHVVYRDGPFYPANVLKNVALRNVHTEYLFFNEINYLPVSGLYAYLKKTFLPPDRKWQKKILTIAVFEQELKNIKRIIYKNKYSFVSDGEYDNETKWRTTMDPYKIDLKYYDVPYVSHKSVPDYPKGLVDLSWPRKGYLLELEAKSYEFLALPKAFVVHVTNRRNIRNNFLVNKYAICLEQQKADYLVTFQLKYKYVPQI